MSNFEDFDSLKPGTGTAITEGEFDCWEMIILNTVIRNSRKISDISLKSVANL